MISLLHLDPLEIKDKKPIIKESLKNFTMVAKLLFLLDAIIECENSTSHSKRSHQVQINCFVKI